MLTEPEPEPMEHAPAYHNPHEDLAYIRRTLDAAGRLSSVSGRGLVLIGFLGLGAVAVNALATGAPWQSGASVESLGVWAVCLVASFAVGVTSMDRKARRMGQRLWTPVLQKALWSYASAMVLGAILSFAVLRAGQPELLPALWLGCYGAALTSTGVFSVSPVRWMGISFVALSLIAALAPPSAGLALLALGFGWLHVGFGAYIAGRHDG